MIKVASTSKNGLITLIVKGHSVCWGSEFNVKGLGKLKLISPNF